MVLYLCPKCFQVFACEQGKKLTYCCNCPSYITKTLPCPNYDRVTRVILECWCITCESKRLTELN